MKVRRLGVLAGLLALLAAPVTGQRPTPPRLALIDATGSDSGVSTLLAATVRRELRRYEAFQLYDSIATAGMADMHADRGRCATRDCFAPVGEMLGVEWVATTEASRSGAGWLFTASVWSVRPPSLTVTERRLAGPTAAADSVVAHGQALAQAIARVLGATPLAPLGAVPAGPAEKLDAETVRQRLGAGGADLSGLDLGGLDLHDVDFRHATLVKVRLAGARLAGANLFSCDLTDADLSRADLTGANLDGTTLRRTNLRGAVLLKASLFATIIESADLREADLRETRIIGYLRKANLAGARLMHANIGADPGNQSMGVMRAQFVSADLSGADFSGANLYKADFSYARLVGARLADADLRNTELVQADFTDADVTGADVTQADLAGAIFHGTKGVSTLKGLAQAKNRDKAVFDAPVP
jgi:uncharacterized protein YjbI with pentapeptide repeats